MVLRYLGMGGALVLQTDGGVGHFPLYGIFYHENTPYGGVCMSHFVQKDFLGTSKRVFVCAITTYHSSEHT